MKKKKQTHTRQKLLKQVSMAMLDTTKEKTKTNAYWPLKTQKSPPPYSLVIFHTSQVCSSNHTYNHSYSTNLKFVHLIIHTTTPIPHMASCSATNLKYPIDTTTRICIYSATNIKYPIDSYSTHVQPLYHKYLDSYSTHVQPLCHKYLISS